MNKKLTRLLVDLSVGCVMGVALLITTTEFIAIIAASDFLNTIIVSETFYLVLPWSILSMIFWLIGSLWKRFVGRQAKLQAYFAGFVFVVVPMSAYSDVTTKQFLWSLLGGLFCLCFLFLGVRSKKEP